jgi:prevent-host-death family protein
VQRRVPEFFGHPAVSHSARFAQRRKLLSAVASAASKDRLIDVQKDPGQRRKILVADGWGVCSRILEAAENKESVVITRRGQPVAIVAPYRGQDRERERAIDYIMAFMRKGAAYWRQALQP